VTITSALPGNCVKCTVEETFDIETTEVEVKLTSRILSATAGLIDRLLKPAAHLTWNKMTVKFGEASLHRATHNRATLNQRQLIGRQLTAAISRKQP